jgi:hypothetical protein
MEFKPIPKFDFVKPEEILKASIFVFYGGTKLTEIVGNRIYKHPYWPASFHTAGGMGGPKLLNVNKITSIEDIRSMYQSTRRIDVIELLDLTDEERDIIYRKFERDAGHNIYDAIGYLRKGSKLKALRFLKYFHASDKDDYCSDNVVDNFSEPPYRRSDDTDEIIKSLILPRFIQVCYESSEDSTPWGMLEQAMAKNFQNGTRRIRTVHVGTDFLAAQKKKFPGLV